MLPAGGRGTDRVAGEFDGDTAPERAPAPAEGPENDLALLWGGRGTLRFAAICGALRFMVVGLLTLRLDIAGFADGRPWEFAGDVATLRGEAVEREEFAGGLIRLTVGREVVAADGCAAGRPAFGPSMAARVGDALGLAMLALEIFRRALGEMLARFEATGRPRSRVFRETAVSAPGLAA